MLEDIRGFFFAKGVMEVETPLLCRGTGTDPNLAFFHSHYHFTPQERTLYLQTSPEFAMKRLLAAGSGSIFQICKAFRNGEQGRLHNPEFTILEWYRMGYNLEQLMDEIEALLQGLLTKTSFSEASERFRYADVFQNQTGIDPLVFSLVDYRNCARDNNLLEAEQLCGQDHALWLDFLFSHLVQPQLGKNTLCLVYGFPACQASLARLNSEDPRVAERVEVFVQGIELGNGFFELTDPVIQEQRFDNELAQRQQDGLPVPGKDMRFLSALKSGLPDCAGMALGLDRLLLIMSGHSAIENVLAFPISRA